MLHTVDDRQLHYTVPVVGLSFTRWHNWCRARASRYSNWQHVAELVARMHVAMRAGDDTALMSFQIEPLKQSQ